MKYILLGMVGAIVVASTDNKWIELLGMYSLLCSGYVLRKEVE